MPNHETTAKEFWDSSEPIDTSPYLKAKKIKSHGYRITGSGDLMIPMHDANGLIQNYQLVDGSGEKLFFSDEDVIGNYHSLGQQGDGPIVMCLDFESGATIYEITRFHTIITFTEDNLLQVAQAMKQRFPDAPFIIAGSHKQSNAVSVAHQISARYITPEFSPEPKHGESSFNDLLCRDGYLYVDIAFDDWESKPVLGPKKFSLSDFSLKGQSAALKKQMLDDVYVLGELALLGQWTVFYAAPNAGKTLITIKMLIDALKAGNIKGENVFYVNADDDRRGLVTKLELAEKYGFEMLVPSEKGFESERLKVYLNTLVKEESSNGKIIILDTLKKFVDIMHKTKTSDFGKFAREFVSHGGTLIGLAHVNKNKDSDNKSVFGGTSDIRDDADCCYNIEVIQTSKTTKTIRFENHKSRGNVVKEATYQYSNEKLPYLELLDSIKTVSEAEAIAMKEIEERNKTLAANKEVIDSITSHIKDGITNKTELIKAVNKATMVSNSKVKAVLEKHTGDDYGRGNRWSYSVGEKNVHNYFLISAEVKSYKDY